MGKSFTRLRLYIGWLLASAFVVVAACFLVNCLVAIFFFEDGTDFGGNGPDAIGHGIRDENGAAELFNAFEIARTKLRDLQDGFRHHALHRREDRTFRFPEHLVEAMGHENHFASARIMVEAPIILVLSVAVPIPEHHVKGDVGEEAIQIERFLQTSEAFLQIGFLSGFFEGDATGLVLWVIAAV